MASAPTDAGALYRLADGVAKLSRASGTLLLTPADGRAMRISGIGNDLLPLLAKGASFAEIEHRLRETHPSARDIDVKLRRFLTELARVGLLTDRTQLRARSQVVRRFALLDIDPAAARLARLVSFLPQMISWLLLACLLLCATSGPVALLRAHGLASPSDAISHFDPLGLLIFIVAVVPLHEFSHGFACRLAGAPVGKAGLILHGWIVPGPYVDTSRAYRIRSGWRRAAIAASGPLVDFIAAGAASWLVLLVPGGAVHAAGRTLLLLSACFVFLDLNPLAPSDGSRVIEALLGDELARASALSRRRAALSSRRTVAIYRVACSIYVQALALGACIWWISTT
jgi:putative peptide zinc metalloprotease protein